MNQLQDQPSVFPKYGVVAAYLFGSKAAGPAHAHSDLDLGVLFREYHPKRHNLALRLALMEELSDRWGEQVDLVFLQGAPIAMRYEVIAKGRIVYCTDDGLRTDFEDVTCRDYLDFRPFLDQFYREVTEAVKDGYFFPEH